MFKKKKSKKAIDFGKAGTFDVHDDGPLFNEGDYPLPVDTPRMDYDMPDDPDSIGPDDDPWAEVTDFPQPKEFRFQADEVPTDDEERDASDDLPIDYVETPPAYDDAVHDLEPDAGFGTNQPESQPRMGRHGQVEPEHQVKSRRSRRILIVLLVLLLILCGVGAYFGYKGFQISQQEASQVTQQTATTDVDKVDAVESNTKDASTANEKKNDVPDLVSLMDKTKEEALSALSDGAVESLSQEVNEEGNATKTRITVTLTKAASDAKAGLPVVYLNLNDQGRVIGSGYSAATSGLGYGTMSFKDAVSNERIIEHTLKEAGLEVAEDSVTLPDVNEYTTFGADGTTILKENGSFSGSGSAQDRNYNWSAVLTYDYTASNASGNLNDTIRKIYVSIG